MSLKLDIGGVMVSVVMSNQSQYNRDNSQLLPFGDATVP